MDRSFLDLLDEPTGKKKSSSKSANTADPTAPIELVTEVISTVSVILKTAIPYGCSTVHVVSLTIVRLQDE